jgi:signal transduction histidine kinase
MHKLLQRQLKRCLSGASPSAEEWALFVSMVNEAYDSFDADRSLLERSMDISSNELIAINQNLRDDMAQRARMQQILLQSEKMAGIGQFAAGVAHDVNNPIGVILGFIQSLIRKVNETDALYMPYKSIEREALRCKTLIQNLLAFSRGQGNEPKIQAENLNDVIENALVLVETLARSKHVQVVRPSRVELPPLFVDSNQIQQVVINLCTNAIDAMPSGGTLTLSLVNKETQVSLLVQDTGMGIPPEIRDHIFEAFYTTKEVGKGTGLGLSIISNILKTHQGTIEVQTEVGKGTLFTITLPVLQANPLTQKIAA